MVMVMVTLISWLKYGSNGNDNDGDDVSDGGGDGYGYIDGMGERRRQW